LNFGAHFENVMGRFGVVDNVRGFVVVGNVVGGIVSNIANLGGWENCLRYWAHLFVSRSG